jgi:hypothetical protein
MKSKAALTFMKILSSPIDTDFLFFFHWIYVENGKIAIDGV